MNSHGELFLLWFRVLWKGHINPWFVEVMWVKPQLVDNEHGIIKIIWFLEELVDLWVNS